MLVLKYQAVYNHTDSFMLVLKYQEVYNHTDSFVLVLKYQEVYNHTDNTLYQVAFLLVLQLLTMLIETQIKPKSFELRWNQLFKQILDGHSQSLLQVCLDAMLLPQS